MASRMMVHFMKMLGIGILGSIFYLAALSLETYLVDRYVVPAVGTTLDEWIDGVRSWVALGIGGATTGALLWYVYGQWLIRVDDWRRAGGRGFWSFLLLLNVAVVVLGVGIYVLPAQEGAWIIYCSFVLSGVLAYYLSTVVFGPPSVKYSAPLSNWRRW